MAISSTIARGMARERRAAASKWLVLGLLMMLAAVSYIDRTIISLLVDQIRADLKVSDVAIGLIQGLGFGLFYAAATLPAGWLVDRFPRRTVLAAGFTFWTFAAAACGLARNYAHLLIARMCVGAGEATLTPATYSLISDLFRRDQLATAISAFVAGATIGSGIAFGVGGFVISLATEIGAIHLPLIGDVRPWQLAFMLTALPSLPLLLMILWLREPVRSSSAKLETGGRGELIAFLKLRRVYLSCHFAGFSLLGAIAFGTVAWLPTYFMRHFGMEVSKVGVLFGLISAGTGVAGALLAGTIVDYMFRKGRQDAHFLFFLVTAPLLAVTALIGFWLTSSPVVALVAWGLMQFLYPFGGIAPAHLQIVTPPHLRGRVSGLYIMSYNFCGLAIGPALVAILNEHVFQEPANIGKAIALNICILAPITMALFAFNLPYARRAVAEAGA